MRKYHGWKISEIKIRRGSLFGESKRRRLKGERFKGRMEEGERQWARGKGLNATMH